MNITIEKYNKVINNKPILTNINLEFTSGKIYGIHGHNGSGKTMLIRAIVGLIKPTNGQVKIVGTDIDFYESMGIV